MKKRVFGRKFSRDTNSRIALLRSLARSFINSGRIETTVPRAKAIKPIIDRLVTLTKKKTLVSHRELLKRLAHDTVAVRKLEEEVGARFATLSSGFTKVLRVGERAGDNAPMARLSWSRERVEETEKQKDIKTKKQSKP